MGRWRRRGGGGGNRHKPGSNDDFEQTALSPNDDQSTARASAPAGSHPNGGGGGSGGRNHRRRRGKGGGGRYNHAAFGDHDVERIRTYLTAYRQRAEHLCFREQSEDERDHNEKSGDMQGMEINGEEDIYSNPIKIGKHEFPALTPDNLSAPYLSLPSTLSSRQRRLVHGLCVDVGLYHSGAGNRSVENGRHIAISIHYDGLEHVPNLSKPISIPVTRCMPWYYRNDHVGLSSLEAESRQSPNASSDSVATPIRNNSSSNADDDDAASAGAARLNRKFVLEATAQGRRAIESLIDQPGRCLRDAHDCVDFAELDGMDLSQDAVLPNPVSDDDSTSDVVWVLVDTPEKMEQCVADITESHVSEIGFDLECYNRSKYEQASCLIQLSADGKDYVIDTLAPGVWDAVSLLEPIFSNPSIVKIGHSVTGTDVPSLHRDFGLFIVNCFDTYEAAKALRLRTHGLSGICEHYGLTTAADYSSLKKEYQNTDWRRRPLTEPMIQYGRYDCHFLAKLRMLMIRDLTRSELWDRTTTDTEEEARIVAAALAATLRSPVRDADDGDGSSTGGFSRQSSTVSDDGAYFTAGEESDLSFEDTGENRSENGRFGISSKKRSTFSARELRMHAGLMRAIGLSQEACLRLWKDPREHATKNDAFIAILKRSAYGTAYWDDGHTALYVQLARWRENVARREGTYPGAVCSLDLLVSVCRQKPTLYLALRKIDYFLPALLDDEERGYSAELLSIVQSSIVENGDGHNATLVRSYNDRIVVKKTIMGENGKARVIEHVSSKKYASAKDDLDNTSSTKRILRVTIAAAAAVGLVALIIVGSKKRRR